MFCSLETCFSNPLQCLHLALGRLGRPAHVIILEALCDRQHAQETTGGLALAPTLRLWNEGRRPPGLRELAASAFGEAHTWDTADRFAGVAGASVKSVPASEYNLLLWMTILGGPRRFWSREGLFPSGASFLKTLALLQTSGPDTRGTNAFQTDCSKSSQELRLLAYHVKELLA